LPVHADLHTHTNASDGTLSPLELIEHAGSIGLRALAITDHDTLSGISSARPCLNAPGITVIPGIEISAEYEPGMLHVLGYFPSYPEGFEPCLAQVQSARRERIPRIIEKLNALGIMITQGDVMPEEDCAQVGRPHVARALVRRGYARSIEEAFRRYIGKGKKAYVPKEKMPVNRALSLIRDFGGLPVLAHPHTLQLDREGLGDLIREMAASGLAGIEVHYPDHTADQMVLYGRITRECGLLVTGGTDFHGPDRNAVSPGDHGLDRDLFAVFMERLMR